MLEDVPGEGLVLGLTGQFWRLLGGERDPARPRTADEFLAYERGDTCKAVIDFRVAPGSRLLDVGAGTGKLTALLAAGGTDLVALEPVDAMRSQLAAVVPAAAVVAGTAEAVPLAGASVDGVVAAQAFHWFDGPRALA